MNQLKFTETKSLTAHIGSLIASFFTCFLLISACIPSILTVSNNNLRFEISFTIIAILILSSLLFILILQVLVIFLNKTGMNNKAFLIWTYIINTVFMALLAFAISRLFIKFNTGYYFAKAVHLLTPILILLIISQYIIHTIIFFKFLFSMIIRNKDTDIDHEKKQ